MSAAMEQLRARLEAKREEFLKAMLMMSRNGERDMPSDIADHLFRLLGIVTYWLTLPEPSAETIANINRALNLITVRVVKHPTVKA